MPKAGVLCNIIIFTNYMNEINEPDKKRGAKETDSDKNGEKNDRTLERAAKVRSLLITFIALLGRLNGGQRNSVNDIIH